jgi:CXXC-20-CXXC protein
MKNRVCPNCGYKYSIWRLMFKWIGSSWTCKECKSELSFDIKRRFILSLISAVFIFLIHSETIYLLESGLSIILTVLIVTLIQIPWMVIVSSFDVLESN